MTSAPVSVCAVQLWIRRVRSSKANTKVMRRVQARLVSRLVSDRLLPEFLLRHSGLYHIHPEDGVLVVFFQESQLVFRTRSGRLYGFCTGTECMCMVYRYGQFSMKLDKANACPMRRMGCE